MVSENLPPPPSSGAKPRNPWLLAARPRTLPAALAPVALGSAFAARQHSFQIIPAVLCAVFALLAQIAANFANDYFDFRRGADVSGRLGPTRVVSAGLISPKAMLAATFALLALAACAGLGLVCYGGWGLVIVGAASLLGALAYTPCAYHGLGEIFALVYFGFVAVLGTYYVQFPLWPPAPGAWITAAACGLLAANILLVNNIRDIPTDTPAGKRTLVVRLGRRFGHGLYIFNLIFACAAAALLCAASFGALTTRTAGVAIFTVLILGLSIPLSIFLARSLLATPADNGPRFNRLLALSAQFLALWAFLMSIGIAFS
jgi:1,4-dihydroxy-2-naphthoate octaprenyltransferase